MEVFEKALSKLLEHEGGYSNDSRDSGGETYCGITKKFFGKWEGWAIIDSIADKKTLKDSKELALQVANFYYGYFWYKLKCHEIKNPAIAEMLFITGVNIGKNVAVKKLQFILKVTPDGLIGNETINTLNSTDPKIFIFQFVLELIDFYVQVSTKNSNSVYLRGWILRALSFYYTTLK